jgi:hypothetical protein
MNFASQAGNAQSNGVYFQPVVKTRCQMTPSEVFGDHNSIDVEEIVVAGPEPEEIRVVIVRLGEKGEQKTGYTFLRSCDLENAASFASRASLAGSSGLRKCSD